MRKSKKIAVASMSPIFKKQMTCKSPSILSKIDSYKVGKSFKENRTLQIDKKP